jgi:hypothetical protein
LFGSGWWIEAAIVLNLTRLAKRADERLKFIGSMFRGHLCFEVRASQSFFEVLFCGIEHGVGSLKARHRFQRHVQDAGLLVCGYHQTPAVLTERKRRGIGIEALFDTLVLHGIRSGETGVVILALALEIEMLIEDTAVVIGPWRVEPAKVARHLGIEAGVSRACPKIAGDGDVLDIVICNSYSVDEDFLEGGGDTAAGRGVGGACKKRIATAGAAGDITPVSLGVVEEVSEGAVELIFRCHGFVKVRDINGGGEYRVNDGHL